jgi:phage N-6-adenine-methyltransferase
MSKASDIRFTPKNVLDVVRAFDDIALDPCTTSSNPVGARDWYTESDNGLERPWESLSFVNPPYSRGQIIQWAEKAYEEWCSLRKTESIVLVPADTSTEATQLLLDTASAVAFWRKRICFAGEQGAKFANALFYFGERQGRFKRVFSPHATVLVLR